jgi:phytoene desaturase
MPKRIAVIGSGFSGISAAAYAAGEGNEVYVFEKNDTIGGRARQMITPDGYKFDMGPSWYWMPDIIERFFEDFGYRTADFFELVPLDPQFEMVFSDETIAIPRSYDALKVLFETMEKGSGSRLDAFMKSARHKYEIGMRQLVTRPCYSWLEFATPTVIKSAFKMNLLSDFRRYVGRYFTNPKLKALMEFPVIFLGASPKKIPALYSLMNYGGYALGTWYPKGGFHELVRAMKTVAESKGARFRTGCNVEKIITENGKVTGLVVNGEQLSFDFIIGSSDYQHTESLLDAPLRNYDEQYWSRKTFAPSCLIYYLGFKERIPNLRHHTLFFENDLDDHIHAIYEDKKWPERPLFYACCPSKTDPAVAPKGHENLFLLMPLATGINDDEPTRERYLQLMINRLERFTGATNLLLKADYKKSYCVSNFIADYNAYKGNAYGLANTLSQTAVWKPSIKNKHLPNLFYTGQLTVPGPGVPPSIISGKIVATEVNKIKMPSL